MIIDVAAYVWDNPLQLGADGEALLRRMADSVAERPDPSVQALAAAAESVDYVLVHGLCSKLLGASVPARKVEEVVGSLGGKALGIASVDPLDAAWPERIEQARALGMAGFATSPALCGFHPCHSEAMAMYESIHRLGMPLFIDQRLTLSPRTSMEFARPGLLDEVARTWPGLKIVIGQAGYPWVDETMVMLVKHTNLYTELSGIAPQPWLLYQFIVNALRQGALDRVMLGSGFPFSSPRQIISNLYRINNFALGTQLPVIPRDELRSVVERPALSLLGLSSPDTDQATDEDSTTDMTHEAEHAG
ncbi:MAG: amidohydrolase family protein [Phycisphaeraceae bacterium]|nr:amidohydrolase family protein [Phycisphaeraceae bacterium]